MINILFSCLGNICRSPMAEFVMKDLVRQNHLENQFYISSAATSSEEIGNPVHPGTQRKLSEHGISTKGKYAVQLTRQDYERYDYLIGMERRNVTNMLRILGGDPKGKLSCLLDYTDRPGDIADPWYTGDFEATYRDVLEGCQGLLRHIQNQNNNGKGR